ncbi:MAG: OmpA family protein [Bacteroidaceae bacterium]|nr:OmpA family protein [Bacteroidaceae bacterium]
MNFKKILYTALFAAGCLSASAQTTQTVETFNHHWFIQAQGGAQYTLGEVSFDKLISPNAQIAAGYQFTPVWGLRLSVNGWQSKGGSKTTLGRKYWKWNYVSPTVDATMDLTNLLGGYKKRLVSVGLLAGLGANIGWENDEANRLVTTGTLGNPVGNDVTYLRYLWDGTKVRFTGRAGLFVDFHVSKRVDLGLEANANILSDHYNSKKAENPDWYFNALAGIKVRLGKVTKTVTKEDPCGQTIVEKIVEKPVEKIVEKVVYKDKEVPARETIRRDIFFDIRGSVINDSEMSKVDDIVAYLKKYPTAKVTVTSYADKGTGNAKLNKMYSERRAKTTTDILIKKGIDPSRISTSAKGDTEQPYQENDKNRVSICIAE